MTDPREDYKLLDDETLDLYKGLMGNPLVSGLKREMSANKVGHDSLAMRDRFIKEKFEEGGKPFVERVKKYGRSERGSELKILPFYSELLEGVGDFRVSWVWVTGCAQLGKTLASSLLIADTLVYGRCNIGAFWNSLSNLLNNAPIQTIPVIEAYVENLEKDGVVKFNRSRDRMTSQRYQVEQCTANLSYVSTTRTKDDGTGLAVVGGSAASFTADALFLDEASQFPPGAADPLPRRVDASVFTTRPVRSYGTPGGGGGIEATIKSRAKRNFYPHVECPYCEHVFPLDPFGCLLKKFEKVDPSGNKTETYLSESGRPEQWHHKDPENPVESAYFACPKCLSEIDDTTRYSARYKCLITGEWFRDWSDSIPQGAPPEELTAAFTISPLCRQSRVNLAPGLIKAGLEAAEPRDWQQQALGHPSEANATSITLSMIKRAIEAPTPQRTPEIRLAGVDQGRAAAYCVIADIIPPEGWKKMNTEEVIDKSVRNYQFLGEVNVNALPEFFKTYRVNASMIDQEPDRRLAAIMKNQITNLELGDQISNLKNVIEYAEVEEGGNKLKVVKLRNERFLKSVLLTFTTPSTEDGYPLARLPENMTRWIANPAENSPVRHLLQPRLDPVLNKWIKTGPDHTYYAAMFLETMFYLWLTRTSNNDYVPGNLVTTENPVASSTSFGQRTRRRSSSYLSRPRGMSYLR